VKDGALRGVPSVELIRAREPAGKQNGRRFRHDHHALAELAAKQIRGRRLAAARAARESDAAAFLEIHHRRHRESLVSGRRVPSMSRATATAAVAGCIHDAYPMMTTCTQIQPSRTRAAAAAASRA